LGSEDDALACAADGRAGGSWGSRIGLGVDVGNEDDGALVALGDTNQHESCLCATYVREQRDETRP